MSQSLRFILAPLLVQSLIQLCLAERIADSTSNTVGFIQGDNQRDTISLIVSCLLTLGLCVYSAVHLNVPGKGETTYKILLKEAKWCIIGLFAPELVLYTAWRQRASAKQLCEEIEKATIAQVNEGTRSLDKITKVDYETTAVSTLGGERRHSWTISHGFYATMGGLAIDTCDFDPIHAELFGNHTRLTLTAEAAALLAHCGLLPDLSVDEIRNKNKADALAKLLVIIQAGWMIIQAICRQAFHLPITLLEVHTVAHVVCALLMYVIWWNKPRQVESPTLLRGDWVLPLAAYMYSASRMSGGPRQGRLHRFLGPTAEMKGLVYVEGGEPCTRRDNDPQTAEARGFFLPTSDVNREEPISPHPEIETQTLRRRLAAEAVAAFPPLRSRFRGDESKRLFIPYTTELVQPYCLNWPNAGLLRRTQSLVIGSVLWGASMAYGAIHVAAWNYFFPTHVEKLLWRLSSVWVTFCAFYWLLTNILASLFPFVDKVWVMYNERRLGWLATGVITTLCVLCGVSFVASRAFLVVESFVSIREVPRGVYSTPSWSEVFPHL